MPVPLTANGPKHDIRWYRELREHQAPKQQQLQPKPRRSPR